jgi:hypothetical protein
LYTQVRKGTTTGPVRQAPKTFDIGIQAAVDILNPHLVGLPTFFGLGVRDVFTSSGGNGASDGDPNYTRESSFYLGISGFADCGGLQIYRIPGSDSGTITVSPLGVLSGYRVLHLPVEGGGVALNFILQIVKHAVIRQRNELLPNLVRRRLLPGCCKGNGCRERKKR